MARTLRHLAPVTFPVLTLAQLPVWLPCSRRPGPRLPSPIRMFLLRTVLTLLQETFPFVPRRETRGHELRVGRRGRGSVGGLLRGNRESFGGEASSRLVRSLRDGNPRGARA